MYDAERVIADALFNYRDPPGRTLWGIENSEAHARAVIDALTAAGLKIVSVPNEIDHVYGNIYRVNHS